MEGCPTALFRPGFWYLGAALGWLFLFLPLRRVGAPLELALAVASASAAAVALYGYGKGRRVRSLMSVLRCGGFLERPLAVVPGYLTSYSYSTGRGESGTLRFEPFGGAYLASRLDWGHSSGYVVAAGRDWLYLWLPAYEVADPCCRGIYVAAVAGPVPERGPVSLSASTEEGDYAKAQVAVKGGVIETYLEFWGLKARSARVELHADFGLQKAKVVLAKASSNGVVREVLNVAGRGGLYVVPRAVEVGEAKRIGISPGEVWGLGGGARYKVRLVLDLPLRPDVYAEADL
ncbi:MAG: hypothetical protein ACP5I3_08055 [Thermoproteus sp.]